MKAYSFHLVDAFTALPFRGNPAGVVFLEQPEDAAWMQAVAMEMNQAETAFLSRLPDGFSLRWFTPEVEIDLCGHATLASAHILWQTKRLPADQAARFSTNSGWLTCTKVGNEIAMDFPAKQVEPCPAPGGLLEALGSSEGRVFTNNIDYLVELASETAVRALKPHSRALADVQCRGVIVTAAAYGKDYDFVSRFFAPRCGILEDPVTGSAHCALGPFWAQRLEKKSVRGYQVSKRGGYVGVDVLGDRVVIRGRAVTVVRGELIDASA
jgi:PhzF family phenazine biosynthesis protein